MHEVIQELNFLNYRAQNPSAWILWLCEFCNEVHYVQL